MGYVVCFNSVTVGPDVTQRFLDKNGLELLVRSHEVKEEGYEIEHDGRLITVFSVPNYCDQVRGKIMCGWKCVWKCLHELESSTVILVGGASSFPRIELARRHSLTRPLCLMMQLAHMHQSLATPSTQACESRHKAGTYC